MSTPRRSGRPDPRPRSYRLVVPPQWWRIPLEDEETARRSATALVREQFSGIDNEPIARANVTEYLFGQVQRAREADGIELYLAGMQAGPLVVPASLFVSYTPAPTVEVPTEEIADALAVSDAASAVREIDVRELPAGEAIRRLAYWVSTEGEGEPVPSINLDWHLPIPSGRGAMVSLCFASSLVTLEEPLVDLFDAIAATFQWTW